MSENFFTQVSSIEKAIRGSYDAKRDHFIRSADDLEAALRSALRQLPTLYPQWVDRIEEYDNARYGPLLGVSDEGSAGRIIADAAHASAKAQVLGNRDLSAIGVIIDGERMTSAGEVPIGPDEYEEVVGAAFARTHCTTNVGVRINARLYLPLPEFGVPEAPEGNVALLERIFAQFKPFVETPDASHRPLTIRLRVRQGDPTETLRQLVAAIEAGRKDGRLGDPSVHRLSLLLVFDDEITDKRDTDMIVEHLRLAADLELPELAIDGELREGSRRRVSVQGLLNILDPKVLAPLLAEAARQKVRLTSRYQIDPESAARTIWTGLHTARTHGMNGAKYGLMPLTLEEQEHVVRSVSAWTRGWTAIPAFYVDTPMLTEAEVFDDTRCADAATLWMERMREAGAKVLLIDSPDRIAPRRLVKEEPSDRGVLTIDEIERLSRGAADLGLKILWSGGITPSQAYGLAKLNVGGIFTTSSTARRIAVGAVLTGDPQLAAENEPTELGVRRVHALIQGGFLAGALAKVDPPSSVRIEKDCHTLLAITENVAVESAISALDETLRSGWLRHWEAIGETG